ncbi:MAG: NTP transferase domain-containing protein [Deltaproteobacteria bacterium]|jgi:NDP-sugar pyrophosphorylase family protein|nr:NTP transferase domain-containing protein [Deltaproteobacteria bacterium]
MPGLDMRSVLGILLAAGRSTRMGFNKLTAHIGGHPLVWYAVQNLRKARIDRILAVVGHDRIATKDSIGDANVEWAHQEEQLGTGHAAAQAIPLPEDVNTVIVLFGDCPFLDESIILSTLETHRDAGAHLTLATARLTNPKSLGAIVRDEDGTPNCVRDLRVETQGLLGPSEVFAGLSVWRAETFMSVVPRLPMQKLTGGRSEQNLPDAVAIVKREGGTVASYTEVSEREAVAPNAQDDLEDADMVLRRQVISRHRQRRIEFQDARTTFVDYDVTIDRGTRIGRNVQLLGSTRIGEGCEIGSDTTLRDCTVGDRCVIERGTWGPRTFPNGVRAFDRLAGEHPLFRKPHYLIPEEPLCCFAILPFHDPYLSLLENSIRPIVERHGFECVTANKSAPGIVAEDIWTGINRAKLIIAEVTEDNRNVWYEVGLAHALGKNVVILRQKNPEATDLPFDVSHYRAVIYDPSTGDLPHLLDEWFLAAKKRALQNSGGTQLGAFSRRKGPRG